jgi:hypothetical protein
VADGAKQDPEHERQQDGAKAPVPDPRDSVLKAVVAGLQLVALYFAYTKNEGAQLVTEALVLLMRLVRASGR